MHWFAAQQQTGTFRRQRVEWIYFQDSKTTGIGLKTAKTTMRLKDVRRASFGV